MEVLPGALCLSEFLPHPGLSQKAPHPRLLYCPSAKEQMKKLLELVREYTQDVITKDFRAGDRDQDELSH